MKARPINLPFAVEALLGKATDRPALAAVYVPIVARLGSSECPIERENARLLVDALRGEAIGRTKRPTNSTIG